MSECSLFALFAYDFPHRKTSDFIIDLVSMGVRNFIVLAAPKKMLAIQGEAITNEQKIIHCPPIDTKTLCQNFGIPFYSVAHEDFSSVRLLRDKYSFSVGIISGARIISSEIIGIFPGGIVNFHPGKIPESSGLDAFYHTIRLDVEPGVTTHFIDHKVDAGRLIHFDEVAINSNDTPGVVTENIYQTQRTALRRLVLMLKNGVPTSEPIVRPAKNEPMGKLEKYEVLSRFSGWRDRILNKQLIKKLFAACDSGDLSTVINMLKESPSLINIRNDQGWTPLIVACHGQHVPLVESLLQLGASPNLANMKGTTPLMYAKERLMNVSEANYQILDMLIDAGADLAARDCFGKSVVDYVYDRNDLRMLAYFSERTLLI
ncbi:ankyrin repeat domain-containing protein [Stutzerimonas nitrititolerans]|uniref:ankyrin repeat domain-containing protein n=1 Tax=Stutzerimonas nitrititolerans TaxID=2482751 RepID=UPI00289B55A9|nr:ankyrin repeat domain-containing protein [Stutzerimonas nitrititolerans]